MGPRRTLIFKDHLLQVQDRYIWIKTKSGKKARRLLDKLKPKMKAYRRWKHRNTEKLPEQPRIRLGKTKL